MKKYFVVILMAMAVAMPSKAQVKFGLKGGLNLTNMSFNKSEMEDLVKNKAGFFVGPTLKISLPIGGLGFDIAALYDQREAKYDDKAGNQEATLKQQTLQIPVNVRFGTGLGDKASIFIFAGPQFGFNIGDKDKKFGADEWTMNSSTLSGNIGLGLILMDHLQISANYNIALGKTGEYKEQSTGDQVKEIFKSEGKSNAWQIALAYYF